MRRVDGRSLGQFVADEIVAPLGVDLWIGLPEAQEHRVSPIIGGLVSDDLDPAMKQMVELMMGPATRGGRALSLSGAFAVEGTWNRRDVHAAQIPAANCISNAASLAKVYAATLGSGRRRAAARRRDPRPRRARGSPRPARTTCAC